MFLHVKKLCEKDKRKRGIHDLELHLNGLRHARVAQSSIRQIQFFTP